MARKSNITVISKVIAYSLIIILLAVSVNFLSYHTNGFTTDFTTFYVEYNSEIYNGTHTGIELENTGQSRFDVKYPLSFLSKNEQNGYSLKIVPSSDKDFTFKVNEMEYSFRGESDLTSGFDIEYNDGYFLISNDFTLESVLKKIYSEETVEVPEPTKGDYFTLVISSYNRKSNILINFHKHIAVQGIKIEPGAITI